MSRLTRIHSLSSRYNGRSYCYRNSRHDVAFSSLQNRSTFWFHSKALSIVPDSLSINKASLRFSTKSSSAKVGEDSNNKIGEDGILERQNNKGNLNTSISADLGSTKENLESIVQELLAKQNIQGTPIILTQNSQENTKEEELLCVINDYDDPTLKNARKVIRHYSSIKRPFFNLDNGKHDNSTGKNAPKTKKFYLPGSHLCHTILTTAILPKPNMTLTDTQVDIIIELFLLTIQSFTHSSKRKRYWQEQQRRSANLLENGVMSEGLLRLLLSTNISFHDSGQIDPEKKSIRMRKLLFCYNATLDNWAKIAANIKLTSIPNALSVSRDAAIKAEQLLLEMALARSQHQLDDSVVQDELNQTNLSESMLSYVKPDVVSFNTVITAWSESAKISSIPGKEFNRSGIDTNAAAERAQAILTLMKDLSDEVPILENYHSDNQKVIRPDRRSYDAVIQAWSNSSLPDARDRVLEILNDMMERYDAFDIERNKKNIKLNRNGSQIDGAPPFPTARTLSSIFSSLAQTRDSNAFTDTDAEALLSQTKKWYNDRGLIWKPDTILYNSLLAVVQREASNDKRKNLSSMYTTCCRIDEIIKDMIKISKNRFVFCKPDSVTYGVAISSWASLSEEASLNMKGKNKDKNKILAIECAEKAGEYLNKIYLLKRSEEKYHVQRRQERHYLPSTQNINDTIKAYCAAGEPEKAEDILREACSRFPRMRLNVFTYLYLINGFINTAFTSEKKSHLIQENAVEKAQQLLEEMEQMICEDKMTVNSSLTTVYNDVIAAYARLGTFESVKKAEDILLFKMMNVPSTNLSQQGGNNNNDNKINNNNNNNRAHDYSNSKSFYVKPNTYSFATIFSAYSRLCAVPSPELDTMSHSAQTLLRAMEMIYNKRREESKNGRPPNKFEPNVTPNVVIYNTILTILGKQTRFARSISAKEGHLKNCEDLIQHMENLVSLGVNKYVTPDKYSYGILIGAIADSKVPDAGSRSKSMLDKFTKRLIDDHHKRSSTKNKKKQNGKSPPMIDITLLNTVLKAMNNSTEKSSCNDALDLLKRMEDGYLTDDGTILAVPHPDKFSYCTVIAKLAKTENLESAFQALQLLSNLDTHFHAIQSGEKQLMENERLDLFEPDTYCYNSVLAAFSHVGTVEAVSQAEKLLEKMEKIHHQQSTTTSENTTTNNNNKKKKNYSRIKPDLISFRTVIRGWLKCGNANRAKEILNHMETLVESGYQGIKPDDKLKKMVAEALSKRKKT